MGPGLFRSISLCLFGTEELHTCMGVLCCYIFNENWLYFEHPDRMLYLYEYDSVQNLIHDTASKNVWGGAVHIKAMSAGSNRDIFMYQAIDSNDINKLKTIDELQRDCGAGEIQTIHLRYSCNINDNFENRGAKNPVAILLTDPGTNISHYSAILPKNHQCQLLIPKYRGDIRAVIDENETIETIQIED